MLIYMLSFLFMQAGFFISVDLAYVCELVSIVISVILVTIGKALT